MWTAKKFNDLTPTELFEIYQTRAEVFNMEQNIHYVDPDVNDTISTHLFEKVDGKIAAYARIFQKDNHVTFGRVLTTQALRGTGKGRELLAKILEQIAIDYPGLPVEIDAQSYAIGYYAKNGFTCVGDEFLEEGIKHTKMIHVAL
ncbi:GNAT family N-acetyltransferase [Fructilactobacillus sp. Tb1]|uniref:GNAT family N-acetyltransferase n=1 Tax=Fructilactobacillus sp. Tb1 TaxID=3422304 RepID=UPI003D2D451F